MDVSSQRAIAGLGYVLMQSAADGAASAERFVPQDVPSTSVDEVEAAPIFVDLDPQADAVRLDDPHTLIEDDLDAPQWSGLDAPSEEFAPAAAAVDAPVASPAPAAPATVPVGADEAEQGVPVPVPLPAGVVMPERDEAPIVPGRVVAPVAEPRKRRRRGTAGESSSGGYTGGSQSKSILNGLDWLDSQ